MMPLRLKLLEAGIMLVMVAAPFFFGAVDAWAGMSIAAVLFFLLFILPRSILELNYIPKKILIGGFIVFVWICVQSFFMAVNMNGSVTQLLKWLSVVAAMAVVIILPKSAAHRLIICLVVVGVAESLYALIQINAPTKMVLWLPKEFDLGFATGTYLHRDQLAGLLELSLGFHLGLWLHSFWRHDSRGIMAYGLLLPIPLYALFKTGSHAGFAGFFAVLAIGVFFLFGRKRKITILFLFFLLILASVSLWLGKGLVLEQFDQFSDTMRIWHGKLTIWGNSLSLLSDYGMTGTGLGGFEWVFPQYHLEDMTLGAAHAYNDYLELAIALGGPAFIVLALTFLSLIFWVIRHYSKIQHEEAAFIWGGAIGIFAFLIHSFTNFNFSIPANALLFCICVALLIRVSLVHDFPLPLLQYRGRKKIILAISRIFIALAAMILVLFSARKAMAGYWHFQAAGIVEQAGMKEAVPAFERALSYDPGDSHIIYDFGLAAWKAGIKEGNHKWFRLAAGEFEKFSDEMPFYGRAWLYRGLAKLYLFSGGSSERTMMEKQEALAMINKAFEMESGSAWISYMTGINMLLHSNLLSEDEINLAMLRIRRSLDIAPSRYLRSALSFLWTKRNDIEVLKEIVPENYESYQIFMYFLKKDNLWKDFARIFPEFSEIQDRAYKSEAVKGLSFLKGSDYRRAMKAFKRAYAINPGRNLARGGLLAVQEAKSDLPADYRKTLEEILAAEEKIPEVLRYLEPVIQKTEDPYLLGLYEYRLENFEKSINWFKMAESDRRVEPRYLAEALMALGRREEAASELRTVLAQQEPDVRDLLLLKELAPGESAMIGQRVDALATKAKSFEAWSDEWGKRNRLHGKGSVGMELNLLPGKRLIEVNLKGVPEKDEYGVLIFRLDGQLIGTAYAIYEEWYKVLLPTETSGGRRRLEAELVNNKDTEKLTGPWVYLGDVEIR